MQQVPVVVRSTGTRVAAVLPERRIDVGRAVLAAGGAALFFAAAADALGVVLHLMGVMPLLP